MLFDQVFPSPCSVLLLGPKLAYKSSVAFRLAYEDAYKGGNPLYVCARSKITTPFLEVGIPQQASSDTSTTPTYYPEILSRIRLKYVDNVFELKQILLGLPCLSSSNMPSLLVVDDLTYLLDQQVYQHLPTHYQPHSSPQSAPLDMKFLESYVSVLGIIEDSKMFLQQQHHHALHICIVDNCVFLEHERGIWGTYVHGLIYISKSLQGEVQLARIGGYGLGANSQAQIMFTVICTAEGKLTLL